MLEKFSKFGFIDFRQWNNEVMPHVKSGNILERKDLLSKEPLQENEIFNSILEDQSNLFIVIGLKNLNEMPYVQIQRFQ